MPIHDWSKIEHGIFHHFHQMWTAEIVRALNGGVLPSGFFALAEQVLSGPIPDVVTLERQDAQEGMSQWESQAVAVADAPPAARIIRSVESDVYAARANRVSIRHGMGNTVTVIEIVSPGNKSSRSALRSFVEKVNDLLQQGISLLIVDLLPPSSRDPQGLPNAIAEVLCEEPIELPADKRLTVAAYDANFPKTAYIEPMAVGDVLPSLPIFLAPGLYVPAPLETTYETTWKECPGPVRQLFER